MLRMSRGSVAVRNPQCGDRLSAHLATTQSVMSGPAIILAPGMLPSIYAKTSHGLIRGPSRYPIAAVVDPSCAGRDAGEVLDGEARGIPVVPSVGAALNGCQPRPEFCIVGVATSGGVIPDSLRAHLLDAATVGLSLVNGLHQQLGDDPELVRITRETGAEILDLRRPRPARELRFWTGEIATVKAPRVAVLGTDCAVGKRTTTTLLLEACSGDGLNTEFVYTGQTAWLQGAKYGFLFDATPNDFVSGELEGAVLACAREADPDLILLEGQSALRNPSGPCGAEFILSAGATGVVLQHSPTRVSFEGLGDRWKIPPLHQEIELISLLGAEVLAVTLNEEGIEGEAENVRRSLAQELGIPVVLPLRGGMEEVVAAIKSRILTGERQ